MKRDLVSTAEEGEKSVLLTNRKGVMECNTFRAGFFLLQANQIGRENKGGGRGKGEIRKVVKEGHERRFKRILVRPAAK